MLKKKNKKQFPEKTIYLFDAEGSVIIKVVSNSPTRFPEKIARANEILIKAKLLPPVK